MRGFEFERFLFTCRWKDSRLLGVGRICNIFYNVAKPDTSTENKNVAHSQGHTQFEGTGN